MTAIIDLTKHPGYGGSTKLSGEVLIKRKALSNIDSIINQMLIDSDPGSATCEVTQKYRKKNLHRVMSGIDRIGLSAIKGLPTFFGRLWLTKTLLNNHDEIETLNFGLVGCKFVTNNGVAFIVDSFQNLVEDEIMRYHGFGTTNTAENVADTALAAECTTVLNADSTRGTGTLAEGATGNIYRTVGTVTFDGSATVVEHGVFSQAATGGGVLLDRTVFGGISVVTTNSLQATYELTLTAGS